MEPTVILVRPVRARGPGARPSLPPSLICPRTAPGPMPKLYVYVAIQAQRCMCATTRPPYGFGLGFGSGFGPGIGTGAGFNVGTRSLQTLCFRPHWTLIIGIYLRSPFGSSPSGLDSGG